MLIREFLFMRLFCSIVKELLQMTGFVCLSIPCPEMPWEPPLAASIISAADLQMLVGIYGLRLRMLYLIQGKYAQMRLL